LSVATYVFLLFSFSNFSFANESRLETLSKASQVCSDPSSAEQMAAYCDLVFGFAKESPLSPRGVLGKRILIGRCDHDSDCPSDSTCLNGRCHQDVLNLGSCRSDFDCLSGEKCENSTCSVNK